MCQDLSEYDPFEPLWLMNDYYREELYDEPMSDEDWEEFLNFDVDLNY